MTKTARTFKGAPAWTTTHVAGVPWHDAPAPPARHKHHAQTIGENGYETVMRCPCGAFRRRDALHGLGDWFLMDAPRVAPRKTLRQLLSWKA